MSARALSSAEVFARLSELPDWKLVDGRLARELRFLDFKEALRFMNAVGEEAERMQHHPEWKNVYNRLSIELVTHDASPPKGALTELDFALGLFIERLLPRFKQQG
jgi:4a-hydroxytetrahydrobiopterin dehydratase